MPKEESPAVIPTPSRAPISIEISSSKELSGPDKAVAIEGLFAALRLDEPVKVDLGQLGPMTGLQLFNTQVEMGAHRVALLLTPRARPVLLALERSGVGQNQTSFNWGAPMASLSNSFVKILAPEAYERARAEAVQRMAERVGWRILEKHIEGLGGPLALGKRVGLAMGGALAPTAAAALALAEPAARKPRL